MFLTGPVCAWVIKADNKQMTIKILFLMVRAFILMDAAKLASIDTPGN